jgi:hypothetical protein
VVSLFDPKVTLTTSLLNDSFAAIAAVRAWPSTGSSRPTAVTHQPATTPESSHPTTANKNPGERGLLAESEH